MNPHRGAPRNLEAERRLLGAILRDPRVLAQIGTLAPDDLYLEAHQHIARAVLDIAASSEPIDAVIVGEELRRQKRLDTIGGPKTLVDLMLETPTTVGAEHHAEIVRAYARVRRVLDAATRIAARGYRHEGDDPDPDLSPAEAALRYASWAERQLVEAIGSDRKPVSCSLAQAHARVIEDVEAMARGELRVIPTPWAALNRQLDGGMRGGELVIVAGRPGMGKTLLGLHLLEHAAQTGDSDSLALLFELEMATAQIGARSLARLAHGALSEIRRGEADAQRLREAAAATRTWAERVLIDDRPARIDRIVADCRRHALRHTVRLIAIDYGQLVHGTHRRASREQEVAEVSRAGKALAKELDCPVVMLAQLNRACEQRTDKRPLLSDLRESGQFEQDADVIAFVYREEVYKPDAERGLLEVLVRKQRDGATGTVRLSFSGPQQRISELSDRAEPPGRNEAQQLWGDEDW